MKYLKTINFVHFDADTFSIIALAQTSLRNRKTISSTTTVS